MKLHRNSKFLEDHFWCKFCGSNEITVSFRYIGYGTALLTSVCRDGEVYEYDDEENTNRDNQLVDSVECPNCGKIAEKGEDLITTEVDDVKDLDGFVYETR